jgi:hypothetical protein
MNELLIQTYIRLILNKYTKLNLCAFRTINEIYPFNLIMLVNTQNPGHFMLPILDLQRYPDIFSHIDKIIFQNLYNFLYSFESLDSGNREKKIKEFLYKGYYEHFDELYVFIEILDSNINKNIITDTLTTNHFTCFALVSEITNDKHLYGMPIETKLSRFLINNISLFTLKDSNCLPYEHPIVGYVGKKREMLHYIATFGVSKSSFGSIFGPYYYFTNYENTKDSECVFRFALCLGNCLIKENLPNDTIIFSPMKQDRLNSCENNSEKMKIRITDYNGEWTHHYDSVILPNVDLDDGTYIDETPLFCVKNREQFYCLGCLKRETKINILQII